MIVNLSALAYFFSFLLISWSASSVLAVRLVVEGSGQAAYYSYFDDEWGFSRDFQQDEVYLQQTVPLDLRIYERTVHVTFQLR